MTAKALALIVIFIVAHAEHAARENNNRHKSSDAEFDQLIEHLMRDVVSLQAEEDVRHQAAAVDSVAQECTGHLFSGSCPTSPHATICQECAAKCFFKVHPDIATSDFADFVDAGRQGTQLSQWGGPNIRKWPYGGHGRRANVVPTAGGDAIAYGGLNVIRASPVSDYAAAVNLPEGTIVMWGVGFADNGNPATAEAADCPNSPSTHFTVKGRDAKFHGCNHGGVMAKVGVDVDKQTNTVLDLEGSTIAGSTFDNGAWTLPQVDAQGNRLTGNAGLKLMCVKQISAEAFVHNLELINAAHSLMTDFVLGTEDVML